MKKILTMFAHTGITISLGTYLLVAFVEVFSLDSSRTNIAYWCLLIGSIGIGFIVKKYFMKSLNDAKLFFIEADAESSAEEMAKIAKITFSIATFLLSVLTISSVIMIVGGYNILNKLGPIQFVLIGLFGIVMSKAYLRWSYPKEFVEIHIR